MKRLTVDRVDRVDRVLMGYDGVRVSGWDVWRACTERVG